MSDARRGHVVALCLAVIVLAVSPAASMETSSDLTVARGHGESLDASSGPPDCPGESWRAVRLHCKKETWGAAVGLYGGTDLFITCDNDRTTTRICVSGSSYAIRMSAESPTMAVDCFFSGDKNQVAETCGDVQLTIN